MEFSRLSSYFLKLEQTASRNEMTEILAELFSRTSADEVDLVCYLSLGRLVPLYESLEFQLAEKMVIRVIGQAFEVGEDEVKADYKKVGDLGEVAQQLKVHAKGRAGKSPRQRAGRQKLKVKDLTILDVYRRLRKIAEESGEGSQQRKVDGLAGLLHLLDSLSCKYVVRMVLGRLRLGFSDVTILDGLSWMKVGDKSLRGVLEKAYFVHADIGDIAVLFKKKGVGGLEKIEVKLGVPIMPALCQRLKSADEMIEKMGRVAVEPKYDGQRVQIHWRKEIPRLPGSSHRSRLARDDTAGIKSLPAESKVKSKGEWRVRAFTRNLEEVSYMFPELNEIGQQIRAREVVLDSEAVGYDPKTRKILPFQQIITRKRKHAISKAAKDVPLRFFVFDILYKNGKSLLNVSLSKRVELLDEVIRGERILGKAERITTDDPEFLRKFHSKQLGAGLEGAVIKKWDDHYIPGRRGWSWVKFKEAEEKAAGLSDTLDCLVMGYNKGRGKRAEFGIGGFLVGVKRGEKYLTVSKIGTGLTDEQWREMRRRADKVAVSVKSKEYGLVNKALIPDVWVAPKIVVEIAADNITKSPVHAAGLALRFPRLVRFRDDKNPGQVTTAQEVKRLYKLQK
jgi:DNA ligase-1